jgi:hypothetical protein
VFIKSNPACVLFLHCHLFTLIEIPERPVKAVCGCYTEFTYFSGCFHQRLASHPEIAMSLLSLPAPQELDDERTCYFLRLQNAIGTFIPQSQESEVTCPLLYAFVSNVSGRAPGVILPVTLSHVSCHVCHNKSKRAQGAADVCFLCRIDMRRRLPSKVRTLQP